MDLKQQYKAAKALKKASTIKDKVGGKIKSASEGTKDKLTRKETSKKPETEPLIEKEIQEEKSADIKSENTKKSKKTEVKKVESNDAELPETTPGM